MADEPGTAAAPTATPTSEPAQQDKTFTQSDLDRIVEDRLSRERKKYDGFDDLKAKAQRLDELEAANQSEIEKAQTKTAKAERERDEARAALVRFEVAGAKGITGDLMQLLTATTREGLEGQADLILKNAKPADPDFDGGAREPSGPAKSADQEHNEFISALFGGRT